AHDHDDQNGQLDKEVDGQERGEAGQQKPQSAVQDVADRHRAEGELHGTSGVGGHPIESSACRKGRRPDYARLWTVLDRTARKKGVRSDAEDWATNCLSAAAAVALLRAAGTGVRSHRPDILPLLETAPPERTIRCPR